MIIAAIQDIINTVISKAVNFTLDSAFIAGKLLDIYELLNSI